ncbi:hypothetical protein RJ640_019475 [Escallonia rubra]|uniref:Reverse transcriptase Ty1/copia-type domain-containing protein n=1 Tax=Escallonia rubra TaxID=112253 RepID=A0AA88RPK1_9ASTE|nr:hypothetical protein RJ640_019475 [Escallonia rubra]
MWIVNNLTGGESRIFICILIYVDDIILTGNSLPSINRIVGALNAEFSVKDLGPLNYFLGIEVVHTDQGLLLLQRKYITDLLNQTHLDAAKPVHTPMATSTHLSRYHGDPHPSPIEYRSIVGALQYLSFTRPGISFSVNKVAQFMQSPTCEHWSAVKRILRYLKDTLYFGLCLSKPSNLSLSAYSDADWAGCPDDRRSTSGFCVYLGCNLISWSSHKQPTVARSSMEAEYKAIATVASELEWLKSLLSELHLAPSTPPKLWCDNMGSVYLSLNPVFHARTKHVEIDYHFVRERVARKALDVRFISTVDQPADIFTKPLSLPRFRVLWSKLNVVNTLSLRGLRKSVFSSFSRKGGRTKS